MLVTLVSIHLHISEIISIDLSAIFSELTDGMADPIAILMLPVMPALLS